jgi:hypothetical protein
MLEHRMANLIMPDTAKVVHFPDLSHLAISGIYFLLRDGVIVYVGQAKDIRRRISEHIGEGVKRFDSVAHVRCHPERLLERERAYIEKLLPEYNNCPTSRGLRSIGLANGDGRLVGKQVKIRMPRSRGYRTVTVFE